MFDKYVQSKKFGCEFKGGNLWFCVLIICVQVIDTINNRIKNLLLIADENGDGKVTREEIQKACKKDPSLLVMF